MNWGVVVLLKKVYITNLANMLNWIYGSVSEIPPKFHPEFGRFMLESTPGAPYGGNWSSLLTVESNMKLR